MKKFLFASALLLPPITLSTATVYLYPDLRYNPKQFELAFMRVFRVVKAGTNMALIYLTKPHESMDEKHSQAALYLRDAFQRNTGLYIKFGQILASLDFIIPEQYRKTFEVMCVQNLETPYELIKQSIEQSTHKTIDDLFLEFDQKPISSASIAQVHRAVLKDGREVAVKIQHPWLREQMEGDIRLIEVFVDVAERIFIGFKYKWLAEELRENLPKELDFKGEISNAIMIKKMLHKFRDIYVPQIYVELCNESMICMEFIRGTPLVEVLSHKNTDYNYNKIASTLATAFAHQIYNHGFVHSDPHQGNIMLRKHKGRQQVVLLDHGLYTHLSNNTRHSYALLWKGILEQNVNEIKQATQELGAEKHYKLFASMVTSKRFSDLMSDGKSMEDRLRRPREQAELDILIRKAAKKHKQITILLNQIDRRLLMLFKINDFLKNIDFKLGNPINTFQITYQYVSDVMYQMDLKQKPLYKRLIYKSIQLLYQLKFMILGLYLQYI